MEKYQSLIDILIVLLAVISYVVCISLYFKSKKKRDSKFITEILVIFIAILVSTVVKSLIFIFQFEAYDFNGILGCIISGLFTAIGGLQFEGLPILADGLDASEITGNLKTLYYVSSLWSGIIFLTIFSFAISVEFANTCKLRISLFIKKLFKSNKHVYVFASVTEDALTLAHSIEEHHLKKKEKCIIIFSGNIGAFDKLNPLCSEIFSSGYIYHSFNDSNSTKSILQKLKVNNYNEVSLFAFDLNEHMIADDEKNAEIIFSEVNVVMDKLINKLVIKKNLEKIFTVDEKLSNDEKVDIINQRLKLFINKHIKNTINLYVLTKNETNTRSFNEGLKDDFVEKFNQVLKQYDKYINTIWKTLSTKIQISPINEADLAAKDFNKKRLELIVKNKLFNFDSILNDYYKVLSLGFGEKGRAVMMQLYETSSIVDYNGHILPFFANIYDERIDSVSGTFLATHPMFVNIEEKEDENPKETIKKAVDKKIADIYGSQNMDMIDPNTLPRVKFNKQMCLSNEFFKFIDNKSGIDISSEACSYDAIIIALGEDILNIKLANALIRDISGEFDRFNENKNNTLKDVGRDFQFIGVNIRNKSNLKQIEYDLVKSCVYNITDENGNEHIGKTFAIIPFGDAAQMYTYDNIISNDAAKLYSYRYNIVYNHLSKAENKKDLKEFCNQYYNGKESTLGQVISSLASKVIDVKYDEYVKNVDQHWKTESLLSKNSNMAALNFRSVYENYLKAYLNEPFSNDDVYMKLLYACKLEHERWMRFHIANGFKYSEKHDKILKKHKRIVSFEKLAKKDENDESNDNAYEVIIYDAINVAMAFEEDRK